MILFIWIYGVLLAAFYVGVAFKPDYFGNVGFLVVGVLTGIYPVFLIEEMRRGREAKNLAKALFQEFANRVGRCCFDFEDPWHHYLRQPVNMDVFRLRKFVAESPVIFPSVGAKIALLDDHAAQALIDFYVSLASWKRDVENTADAAQAQPILKVAGQGQVQFLARRLRQTLEPGRRALEALSPRVPGFEEIERNATLDGDRNFAEAHPSAGKLYRERIRLMLNATEEAAGS